MSTWIVYDLSVSKTMLNPINQWSNAPMLTQFTGVYAYVSYEVRMN